MSLADVPLGFALVGLALYAVLAGADFGAGIWQLAAGRGARGEALREHAHAAMAPVWEANHVWLIFVLTVTWTCYPRAFGSIASTLAVPLFLAGVGIVIRGAAYALRSGTRDLREQGLVDAASGVSSLLTPFALGTVIGAIASGRVPVGNAAGSMWSSWLNPTSILAGAMAVVTAAYLAAVYLTADAARHGERSLVAPFRARALGAGVVAGAIAIAGLVVVHHDAHRVGDRLLSGPGLPALIVSVLAGAVTLALVARGRFEPARYGAALAVAAIIAGWALSQRPVFLPGLTVHQAAAPHDTLVAATIAVIGGGALLFPSLALLFRLTLTGRLGHFDDDHAASAPPARADLLDAAREGLLARAAVACLVAGIGLLTIAEAGWAHAIGVLALLAFVAVGFLAALPPDVIRPHSDGYTPASPPE
jgi:cytochrome bd ubiquinol oxidase subunit II